VGEADKKLEEAYCRRLMEQIVAYELDPKNFTQIMRARTLGRYRPVDGDYSNAAIGRRQRSLY
jgi:hypothetical protein